MTDLDNIRVFLYLLGVAGWVGGQIVMVGLLPLLRSLEPDVPRIAASAIHATTRSVALRGATGALGGLAALRALFVGAVLVT